MLRHREDFEPFVEDDVPFEKHVANLGKPGTFAGNDAIVAFARNNRVNVVIHQLNAPLWQISGLDKPDARQLHIAYRYGEHYDSVRRISDNSEDPAALKTEMFSKDGANKKCKNRLQNCRVEDIDYETELADEVTDAVQKVRNATGCTDDDVILQNLEEENYNIETTVLAVLQLTELNNLSATVKSAEKSLNEPTMPSSLVENDTGTKDCGNHPNSEKNDGAENNKAQIDVKEENKLKRSIKLSNKQRKEQQRQEKKRRQEERHRQKVLENRSNNAENNDNHVTTATEVTLVKAVATLNI
ncbi:OTU domain-containing protein 3 isoform X2 [Protopterus annectens]|nr:OTU domain-containing protein 3 isoform X2 [Protopterus annectens]